MELIKSLNIQVSIFANQKNKYWYFLLVGSCFAAAYLFTNKFQFFPVRQLPLFGFEYEIPLMQWTVWIYLSDYFFPLMVAFRLKEERNISVMVFAFIMMVIIAQTIFVLFPTIYPRPTLPLDQLNAGLQWLYTTDHPLNCFPSTHVSMVFVTFFGLKEEKQKIPWIALIWATLITISTLTTKQHYFIDIVGGYLLAYGCFAVANKMVVNNH